VTGRGDENCPYSGVGVYLAGQAVNAAGRWVGIDEKEKILCGDGGDGENKIPFPKGGNWVGMKLRDKP
jgi:hypothetical protein